jgi:hypothetical protein
MRHTNDVIKESATSQTAAKQNLLATGGTNKQYGRLQSNTKS